MQVSQARIRGHQHVAPLGRDFSAWLPIKRSSLRISEQMGNEFGAMLQYYAIAAHFSAEALPELSSHFHEQAEEESSTLCVSSSSSSAPVPV